MTTQTALPPVTNKTDASPASTDERYPKTCFECIPPVMLAYPPPTHSQQQPPSRSRHSLRFRTQPVTLTEICEIDEDSHRENDADQQEPKSKFVNEFNRFDHLVLAENIRRTARRKAPLKNYLERQRLKTTREEPGETDDNANA